VTKIPKIKLGKIAKFQQGLQVDVDCQFYSKEENYVQFLRIVDYTNNEEKPRFIEQVKDSPSFVNNNDVVMIRYGSQTAGKVVIGKEGIIANNMFRIIPTINEIEKRYLYYFLKNQTIYNFLMNGQSSSTMPAITFGMMYDVDILLPEIVVQQKIASILSALDSKIELNNSINTELEAMAKTLYDYWFVQFDFPDKNGNPYKTSGGTLVWNEELKREIPEGWEVKYLTEEMDLQYGFPFSTELFNDDGIGVPVIRIRDILNCSISNYSTEEVDDKYRINKGDIIVGMDGNFHINYWNRDNCYLNQRSLRIRSNNESISEIQARYSIEPFIQAREKNVSRTTVGHLSAKDINDLKILKADNEFQIKANTYFNSNLEKIVSNRIQNHKLTELRDWLLPMLMNGQVKVGLN
jgi:type I restriction enzyme S subunit